MVTEDELSNLLHTHGWYLNIQKVCKTRYAYAKRRKGKIVETKYISTERKFSQLTAKGVLEKLGI